MTREQIFGIQKELAKQKIVTMVEISSTGELKSFSMVFENQTQLQIINSYSGMIVELGDQVFKKGDQNE